MKLTIRYILELEFVGFDQFDGELEEARIFARNGLEKVQADSAAIMDASLPDAAALAIIFPNSEV